MLGSTEIDLESTFADNGVEDGGRLSVTWEVVPEEIEMLHTPGGCTMVSAEPLGTAASGDVSFEVEVGGGVEGLEIGVSHEDHIQHLKYAVLFEDAWISSEAGNLFAQGNVCLQAVYPRWRRMRPHSRAHIGLAIGDVVQLRVTPKGTMIISVNCV